jgi:replicative DNA helicase
LQILAPADPRATDKQNADRAVTELKRISRDYKTPVIAISSFNRDNYSTVANMAAFKESGAIEYSSDVLLALQLEGVGVKGSDFNVDTAKQAIPRKVELCILKNRNGQTGAKIPFEYDARFNVFREQGVSDADIATLTGGKAKRIL